ncbi:hypothetical protein [Roseofilum sp. Belize Diploria]|uniref:hypothetical protein n=1 Tax=Roseofilum sp. Belize Diploria TaxID=2821501 RepID=UPI001B02478F|nr:hypothetical protein [Roseofilum sp. Belize Diploria]MBP0006901.1 hypothetical protein [Roseofilum sp. Belize Diploria]
MSLNFTLSRKEGLGDNQTAQKFNSQQIALGSIKSPVYPVSITDLSALIGLLSLSYCLILVVSRQYGELCRRTHARDSGNAI